MQLYPAIDLLDGRAVRLEQGRRDSAKVYGAEPWVTARAFAAAGATRLHVVDLDAAFSGGREGNRAALHRIVESAGADVEVGGGVRSLDDCARLIDLGVSYVVLGTIAVKDPALAARACATHPGRIVIAVDAREGRVSVEGWTQATDRSALDVGARMAEAGAAAVLYTDIGRDGMRGGPNLDATAALVRRLAPCPVIASGGVAALADLDALVPTGAAAVIVGKALYEGAFTVAAAVRRLAATPAPAPRGAA